MIQMNYEDLFIVFFLSKKRKKKKSKKKKKESMKSRKFIHTHFLASNEWFLKHDGFSLCNEL